MKTGVINNLSFLSNVEKKQLLDMLDNIENNDVCEVVSEAIRNYYYLEDTFIDVITVLKDTKTGFSAKAVLNVAKDSNVRKAADFVDILKAVSEVEREDTIDTVVDAATSREVLNSQKHLALIKGVINASSETVKAALVLARSHRELGNDRCLKLMEQLNKYEKLTSKQAYEAIRLIHNDTLVNSKNNNTLEAVLDAACCAKKTEYTIAIVEMAREDNGILLNDEKFIQYANIVGSSSFDDEFTFGSNLSKIAIDLLMGLNCDGDPLDYFKVIFSSVRTIQACRCQEFITSIGEANERTLELLKILSSPDYNPFYSIKAAKIDKVRDSEYCLDVIENIARVEDKTLIANDAYSYLERELELENGELDEETVRITHLICGMKEFQSPSRNIGFSMIQHDHVDYETFYTLPKNHRDRYFEACSMANTHHDIMRINELFNETYNKIVKKALKANKTDTIDVTIDPPDYASLLTGPIRFWSLYCEDDKLAIQLLQDEVKENPDLNKAELNGGFLVRKKINK